MAVFLSYRHEENPEHPDHQGRVYRLGETLRAARIDILLDQFYLEKNRGGPNEGWPKWCEDCVRNSDKVLIVASAGYFECYEGKQQPGIGLGAACEATGIRNELYKAGYNSEKFRIVYFEKGHTSQIPNPIYHIHRFNIASPEGLSDLIAWLNAGSGSIETPLNGQASILWPSVIRNYRADLANRDAEFSFFESMLAGKTAEKAIFIEAPGNHGKTLLISEFISYAEQLLSQSAVVRVDFKGNPTREAMTETMGIELRSSLPNFAKTGNLKDLRLDLRALRNPLLMLFDTYEQAGAEAKEVVNLLLADLERVPAVRLVIAGQSVPDHKQTLWSKSVRAFQLGAIADSSLWEKFALQRFPHLKQEEIRIITTATRGQPGFTWSMIDSFARRSIP